MKTLVFGLDRVLLTRVTDDTAPFDFEVTEKSEAGLLLTTNFVLRPGLGQLLSHVSQQFEVVIFSKDSGLVTNQLVQKIDPSNELVSFVLDKRHCIYTPRGVLSKDLRIILNRQLSDLVLVDTDPPIPASPEISFHHVSPFTGSQADSFLTVLNSMFERPKADR